MEKQPRIITGTSGWSYAHWKGSFYPAPASSSNWLEYYASQFQTVELNNSFHKIPAEPMVSKWRLTAPQGFKYSVKAWQEITHTKRLANCGQELSLFLP